jgi:hypothetical protein
MSKAKIFESVIYLEPIEHKYIHKITGKKYKSVTTTLSSIEPHFDSDGVAQAIVNQADNVKQERYIGLTKQEILDYWQLLNDEANIYGTKVHDIVEKYLLRNNRHYYPPDDTEDDIFEGKVIEAYRNLEIEEGIAMWPERIMFAEQYELAGMSDLVIDIDDVFFDILDHKTNRVFNFYNPYGYETLHKPFDHMQACQWSIYTLQLSVYAYMYELEHPKRKCRQIVVLYWDKTKESFEKIHIMYMKHEAKKLIELHHYNILKNA